MTALDIVSTKKKSTITTNVMSTTLIKCSSKNVKKKKVNVAIFCI